MIIPDIEGYGFESTPNFTGNMDGIPLGSPGAPAACPAPPLHGREGLTIACSTAVRRSAGTRRAAATHRLCSLRSRAPGLGTQAGQLRAYERIFKNFKILGLSGLSMDK